eukprot:766078-Hanusia_phi.AAC.1
MDSDSQEIDQNVKEALINKLLSQSTAGSCSHVFVQRRLDIPQHHGGDRLANFYALRLEETNSA